MACLAYTALTAAAPAATRGGGGDRHGQGVACRLVAAFAKGVLCNWLVCLAVWGTMATTSVAGKILAIFWPITTFVALGFEHSVANMFLIPHADAPRRKRLVGADDDGEHHPGDAREHRRRPPSSSPARTGIAYGKK